MDDKVWYYNDWFQIHGPFTRQEIIQLLSEKKIKKDYHLWHKGLEDWICVKSIDIYEYVYPKGLQDISDFNEFPEFNPSFFKEKKNYNYDKGKSYIKIAGILLIIIGILWLIDSLNYMLFGVHYEDAKTYLILGWNVVASVFTIIVGLEVFKIKSWSYSWGVGIALFNLAIDLKYVTNNRINSKLFFIPIYLAIAILLFNNEKLFKEMETQKAANN